MTIKLYPDRIEIGSFTLAETGSGIVFNGVAQADRFYKSGKQGRVAGYSYGGYVSNRITRFIFSTGSSQVAVGYVYGSGPGNPAYSRGTAGSSSETHGYSFGDGGGPTNPLFSSNIKKFPFAESSSSSVTASLCGNLPVAGETPKHAQSAEATYYTASSPTPSGSSFYKWLYATDFGSVIQSNDLKVGPVAMTSVVNSMTHGYTSGAYSGSKTSQRFPFANNNPTNQVSDMLYYRYSGKGVSGQTHAYIFGGASYTSNTPTPGYATVQLAERFPFTNLSTSTAVGSLNNVPILGEIPASTHESQTHGYTMRSSPAGYAPWSLTRFPFTTWDVGGTAEACSGPTGFDDTYLSNFCSVQV